MRSTYSARKMQDDRTCSTLQQLLCKSSCNWHQVLFLRISVSPDISIKDILSHSQLNSFAFAFPKKQDHKKTEKKTHYYYKNACISAKTLFTHIYLLFEIHHLLSRILGFFPKALAFSFHSRQNMRYYWYFQRSHLISLVRLKWFCSQYTKS